MCRIWSTSLSALMCLYLLVANSPLIQFNLSFLFPFLATWPIRWNQMPGMSQWNSAGSRPPWVHRLAGSLLDSRISSGDWRHDLCPCRHRPHPDGAWCLHPAQWHPCGQGIRKRAELCPARRAAPLLLIDLHPYSEAQHTHLRNPGVHDWPLLQVSFNRGL